MIVVALVLMALGFLVVFAAYFRVMGEAYPADWTEDAPAAPKTHVRPAFFSGVALMLLGGLLALLTR